MYSKDCVGNIPANSDSFGSLKYRHFQDASAADNLAPIALDEAFVEPFLHDEIVSSLWVKLLSVRRELSKRDKKVS